MKIMVRTFIVYVADHPGVLNRVSSLFRRRGYNIESLAVGHTHEAGISRMTVVVAIDALGAPLLTANLYKLAEVQRVDDITSVPSLHRELVIAKISLSQSSQPELLRMLETFGARVLESGPESLVIEATGPEETVNRLVDSLKPFGILEMTRTGRVAMTSSNASVLPSSDLKNAHDAQVPVWNSTTSADLPRNCS
jgi:acetolactate synthase I/III small subunit